MYPSISLSVYLSIYLSIYLPIYLISTYLSIYLSINAITPAMTNCSTTLRFSELKNDSKMALLCSITLLRMVAQQQPKSLQCHYLLENALQPQTVTVNNQLRSKRSSHFVALRSKVHKKVMPGHTKCCTCHAK